MKAGEFSYERPSSIAEAIAIKQRWGAAGRFLAGGQSLMPAINMRFNASECLIDLNRVEALQAIRLDADRVVIGAMARHADVLESPLVRQHLPILLQAGRHLAHSAIRNRGTFGGSVALADPAAEWPAACLLLGAELRVLGDGGPKTYSAADFFQGLYATSLQENDLLESVAIPVQAPEERSAVIELARRHGDFAVAAVMARARLKAGALEALSMVFFGVSDRPLRIPALEAQVRAMANAGQLAEIEQAVRPSLASSHIVADLYHSEEAKRHLCAVLSHRVAAQLMSA